MVESLFSHMLNVTISMMDIVKLSNEIVRIYEVYHKIYFAKVMVT